MRCRHVLLLVCLVVAAAAGVGAGDALEPPGRIVAVGDVHGSIDGLTDILREVEIIDDQGHWIAGSTTLIQLGDLFDRGVEVVAVLDLLMRLQLEAPNSGGEVICLLGNHEAMNILGVVRDVNPEIFSTFVDEESARRRDRAYDTMKSCWRKRGRWLDHDTHGSNPKRRVRWLEAFPDGKLEYLEALGPAGRYGAWLRSLPAAEVRGGVLFIHGGIGPMLRGLQTPEINRRVADEIHLFDTYRARLSDEGLILPTASISEVALVGGDVIRVAEKGGRKPQALRHLAYDLEGLDGLENWFLVDSGGPLWFRGGALWDEQKRGDEMAELLDLAGIDKVVIGHTVQRQGRINSRFADRVIAIDTGMLSSVYKGGRPSALLIEGDRMQAVYPGERFELEDGLWLPLQAD